MSGFFTAHQHILGYLVPYNDVGCRMNTQPDDMTYVDVMEETDVSIMLRMCITGTSSGKCILLSQVEMDRY